MTRLSIKRILSPLLEPIKFLLILTLPLTFFPIFQGTLGGILFPIFQNRHITQTTEAFLQNAKIATSDWGVGGDAPTFQQFQDKNNRFHLTRINSDDWLQKLGFLLPREYSDIDYILDNDVPIDKHTSLAHLMQDQKSKRKQPKEQWLFLTGIEWLDWDGWNAAFDDFLQYSYTNPHLNNSVSFHFAECSTASTASFLCNIWNTRNPALIHFLVDEDETPPPKAEDLEPGLTYSAPLPNLLPVTVRIIELGLQEAYTGHPWTTFPNKTLQLHSLIAKEGMIQQFEPYTSPQELTFLRFNEYMDKLLDAPGTVLNVINEADWWMARNVHKRLGIERAITFLLSISFQISLLVSVLVDVLVVKPTRLLWDEFLGTPKPGDVVFAGMEFDEEEQESGEDIFGFKEIFRKMEVEIQKASSEAGRTAQGGTDPPPETTSAGWKG